MNRAPTRPKLLETGLTGVLLVALSGCAGGAVAAPGAASAAPTAAAPAYPIAASVQTTLQATVLPGTPAAGATIYPYEVAKYAPNGYGTTTVGPGVAAQKRLDLMPSTYAAATATNAARLLNFFAISDIHIADEETPAGAVFMADAGGGMGLQVCDIQ